jgi:nitrogen fixation NifU-like protein
MSDLAELYEELIKDHNKTPRNFRALDDADRKVEGYNPLCGDHYTIYVRMDGDRVEDVSFQGAGCAISKASASLMTQAVKGKTRDEAEQLFRSFQELVTSPPDREVDAEELGKLAVFSGIRKFPVRVKCATLAWQAGHSIDRVTPPLSNLRGGFIITLSRKANSVRRRK